MNQFWWLLGQQADAYSTDESSAWVWDIQELRLGLLEISQQH